MKTALVLASLTLVTSVAAAPLKTTTVSYRLVENTYDTVANAEAERQSTVSAQVTGRIVNIYFRAGDKVQQGQAIMRIDAATANDDVAGMQARVREAEVQRDNLQKQYQRIKELFQQQYVGQAQLDKAEADYKSAVAQVNTLQAGLKQSTTNRNFSTINAPYSGVMSALHVEVGEMAFAGKPLATGYDPRYLRLSSHVPQSQMSAIQRYNKAYIELNGQSSWLSASKITFIPTADARTHTSEVRIALPENSAVLPNQLAKVHFVVGQEQRLVIPKASVLQRSELNAVYVIKPKQKPQLRQIRLGKTLANGWVEVLAGLEAGETIALEPIAAGLGV